jgi:hypothetical protein
MRRVFGGVALLGCVSLVACAKVPLSRQALVPGSSQVEAHLYREHEGAAGGGVDATELLPSARPALRKLALRTLAFRVNVLEPFYAVPELDGVAVTFADDGREGRTVVLDSSTLAVKRQLPYEYGDDAPEVPPYLVTPPQQERVEGGRIWSWTDDRTGDVLVTSSREDRTVLATPPSKVAVGSPRIASDDGHHVVVVFFVYNGEGFSLMAVTFEVG